MIKKSQFFNEDNMDKNALKSGLLVLLGGLTVVVSSAFADRLQESKMSCRTHLTLLEEKIKPLFVLPIKNTEEEAVFAMAAQEKVVVVSLSLTEGNFLFEKQCVRPDGKKVLITVEEKTPN